MPNKRALFSYGIYGSILCMALVSVFSVIWYIALSKTEATPSLTESPPTVPKPTTGTSTPDLSQPIVGISKPPLPQSTQATTTKTDLPQKSAVVATPFLFTFNVDEVFNESSSATKSASVYFWLDSGGEMVVMGGIGKTMQGDATSTDPWYREYKSTNPLDTDQGLHPQNLFRLVTRATWINVVQEAHFKITKDNLSKSPNRNESNGLLLFSRYQDNGQTLYYAGIRVDGTAVIKKKYNGEYYTLTQKKIVPGTYTGKGGGANLLPHMEWIGLKSETTTNGSGDIEIKLYMQKEGAEWQQILSATDTGKSAPKIMTSGYAGIRTDFMDVLFDDFQVSNM